MSEKIQMLITNPEQYKLLEQLFKEVQFQLIDCSRFEEEVKKAKVEIELSEEFLDFLRRNNVRERDYPQVVMQILETFIS